MAENDGFFTSESDSEEDLLFEDDQEREHFMGEYFNEDVESDFEGFGPEDVIIEANVLETFEMEQSHKDQLVRGLPDDEWERVEQPPLVAPFTGDPGIKVDIPEHADAMFFVKMFFDEQFWTTIKTYTNIYAEQA